MRLYKWFISNLYDSLRNNIVRNVDKNIAVQGAADSGETDLAIHGDLQTKGIKSDKAQIYNLIIVDESGSMTELRDVTVSGINETIKTIRDAQKEYAGSQEHYLTLVTFDSRGGDIPPVRTIIDALPIVSVKDFKDYRPHGSTPLYDAMGESLTTLYGKIKNNENATGVVTVLTDGQENSSCHWRADYLRRLIEKLKEEGWTFSYMGSAHNVKEVTDLLSIDNVVEFSHDSDGASNTWARERSSKLAYYRKMDSDFDAAESWEEKKARRRQWNKEYYGEKVTPEVVQDLAPNEIFVFGSNTGGQHSGGAAWAAMRFFGAEWGQGEGIQGNSYAIPTTSGIAYMREAIHRFCNYAREHQNKRFLVTRIGCGIAGYEPDDIAPLFKEAIELENVTLPKDFWKILGLNME